MQGLFGAYDVCGTHPSVHQSVHVVVSLLFLYPYRVFQNSEELCYSLKKEYGLPGTYVA